MKKYTLIFFIILISAVFLGAASKNSEVSIVFDSNRSGTFGIYSVSTADKKVKVVVDTPLHEMYPSPSKDGRKVLFASMKSTKRYAPSEVWIYDRTSKKKTLISKTVISQLLVLMKKRFTLSVMQEG